MTVWQIIYVALLATAIWAGQPQWRVVAVMIFDLAGSIVFGGLPNVVAVIDLTAAALLIGDGLRANVVAMLFLVMVCLETIAPRLNVGTDYVYAGTDILAYLQCAVIGRLDRGMGLIRGAFRRRSSGLDLPMGQGNDTGISVARTQAHLAKHGGGLNGR